MARQLPNGRRAVVRKGFRTFTANTPWSCNDCRTVIRPPRDVHVGHGVALCERCFGNGWVDVSAVKSKRRRRRKRM